MGPVSAVVQEAWDRFADNANWTALHPLDWQRFYDFAILVHRRREQVSRDQVVEWLKSRGVTQETWQALQGHYWTALDVLERYDATAGASPPSV